MYVLEMGGWYKVGKADDVEARAGQIQTACPLPVSVVFVKPCKNQTVALSVESRVHAFLKPWRGMGEWFNCPADEIGKAFSRLDAERKRAKIPAPHWEDRRKSIEDNNYRKRNELAGVTLPGAAT